MPLPVRATRPVPTRRGPARPDRKGHGRRPPFAPTSRGSVSIGSASRSKMVSLRSSRCDPSGPASPYFHGRGAKSAELLIKILVARFLVVRTRLQRGSEKPGQPPFDCAKGRLRVVPTGEGSLARSQYLRLVACDLDELMSGIVILVWHDDLDAVDRRHLFLRGGPSRLSANLCPIRHRSRHGVS